jgi:hypothetical protein
MSLMTDGKNLITDTLEKVASAASRAGSTTERVGKMAEAGVPASVIAMQLTENSRNGNTYSTAEIPTLVKVYQDSKSAVGVTAAQAQALINDQTSPGVAPKPA